MSKLLLAEYFYIVLNRVQYRPSKINKRSTMKKEICVVVDMINGFINEGVLSDPSINQIVPETVKVVKSFLDENKDVLSFQDTHTMSSLEFEFYPPHCLKDTSESELIPELKPFESKMIKVEKDTTNGFFVNSTLCSCPVGKFIDTSSTPAACSVCSTITNCLACTDATTCTTCNAADKFVANNVGVCVCIDGFWDNAGVCDPCPVGCETCTDLTLCGGCLTPFVFDAFNLLCVCPPDTHYFDSDNCSLCSFAIPGCKNCSSSAVCLECTADQLFNPVPVSDKCICSDGFYLDTSTGMCEPCEAGCKVCDDSTTCTECKAGFDDPPVAGDCNCPAGMILDPSGSHCVSSCADISPGCLTCSGGGSTFTCDSCDANSVPAGSNCSCSSFNPTGACDACGAPFQPTCCPNPATYDMDTDGNCEPCVSDCAVCANDGTCLKCASKFFLDIGGNICQPCSAGCLSCSST